MQADPAFPEIPGCFALALYLLTPKWAPAAPVTHCSGGWAKEPKIASFLIIQGSAHKGGILASQIRCTQPPLVTFAASRAFLLLTEGLTGCFSLSAGAVPADALAGGWGSREPRLPCSGQRWQESPGPCHGALQSYERWAGPRGRRGCSQTAG